MRTRSSYQPAAAKFKIALLSSLIAATLAACSSGTTEMPPMAQANAAQFYALPGINYTRIELQGSALEFSSESSPGFEATTTSSDEIAIKWKQHEDATIYDVYRRDSDPQLLNDQLCNDGEIAKQDAFELLDTATTNSYTDHSVLDSRRYEYRVVAVSSDNTESTVASGLIVSINEARAVIASTPATTTSSSASAQTIPSTTSTTFDKELPTGNTESAQIVTSKDENAASFTPSNLPTAATSPFAAVEEKPAAAKPVVLKPVEVKPAPATPEIEKPVEVKPEVAAPITEKPAEVAPVVTAPVIEKPADVAPVVTAPVTEKPAEVAPVVTAPVTEEPADAAPVVTAPITEEPADVAPVVAAPITEEPAEVAPVAATPASEKPTEVAPEAQTPEANVTDAVVPTVDETSNASTNTEQPAVDSTETTNQVEESPNVETQAVSTEVDPTTDSQPSGETTDTSAPASTVDTAEPEATPESTSNTDTSTASTDDTGTIENISTGCIPELAGTTDNGSDGDTTGGTDQQPQELTDTATIDSNENQAGTSTNNGEPALGAAYDGSYWSMTVQPPVLENPVLIEMSNNYETVAIGDVDRVGCEGLIHRIRIPAGQDVLMTMAPGAEPLKYPIYVFGGRNLHVRGLEMRTEVQAGCDVGEAHQMRDERLNIHPRLVGNKVFRFEQSHTTFVEGVDIDLMGQEADCFVMRNPSSMTKEQAIKQRHMTIVNTRCTGIEGLDESPIGDGVHGDFFQNQGKDNMSTFTVENVSFRTSSNGITLHNWNGSNYRPRVFKMRNMDYGWDERYDDDDAYELSGLAYSGHGNVFDVDNVWLNHPKNGNYGFFNGERIGAVHRSNYIEKSPHIFEGTPPGGDFAPEDKVGVEYVSPY